jgi:tRNA pseudouridine55 synthase
LYDAAKAGHTGSLDPLATGLLPICLGEATKLSAYLLDADKRYRVRAAVGACTATGDAEGAITRTSDATALTRAALEEVLPRFTGELLQTPPMYSALKRDGEPLYRLARQGQDVHREPRAIRIQALRLVGFESGAFELDVTCSKGTYIRTLVEDVADAAGQCAHVAVLRRLEAGPFREADMITLATVEARAGQGFEALDACLRPVLDALPGWRRLVVDAEQARRLGQGQAVALAAGAEPGRVAVVDGKTGLLGLAEINPAGRLIPRRWMR